MFFPYYSTVYIQAYLWFVFQFPKDYKIAERIEQEGKGCVIVVNKWDTIPNKNQQSTMYYEEDVRQKLRILNWAPIVYSTATTGQSVDKYENSLSKFIPCFVILFLCKIWNLVHWNNILFPARIESPKVVGWFFSFLHNKSYRIYVNIALYFMVFSVLALICYWVIFLSPQQW